MPTQPTLPRLHHQRGCDCPSCYEWRAWDARKVEPPPLVSVSPPTPNIGLARGLAIMMAEYVEGARKLPAHIVIHSDDLLAIFEKRLARYISADKIAQILSEDATIEDGRLNVGYLAVKIAETCEGKRAEQTST